MDYKYLSLNWRYKCCFKKIHARLTSIYEILKFKKFFKFLLKKQTLFKILIINDMLATNDMCIFRTLTYHYFDSSITLAIFNKIHSNYTSKLKSSKRFGANANRRENVENSPFDECSQTRRMTRT